MKNSTLSSRVSRLASFVGAASCRAILPLVLTAAMGLAALSAQAEVVKAIDMEHHVIDIAIKNIGIDNILLGTDYPYEVPEEAVDFVKKLPISPEDKEKILYGNAEKYILGI